MGQCMGYLGGSPAENNRRAALDAMVQLNGFDVIIVCTGTEHQAAFWQARLERGKGVVAPAGAAILCVHEDWDGGAGNGLGTLYAWTKALKLAETKGDATLAARLRAGDVAAAIYHTAGKGTRLAPLPGAENNNKPGVKLPCAAPVGEGGAHVPLTILEAVVKQTGVYAASRKGRLSVFWGDQVFVPTTPCAYDAPRAHADILCMLSTMPDAATWAARGLEKYGLVAVAASGAACQIEKVDQATAVKFTESLGEIASVGTSLGSFSLTAALLNALLAEFSPELEAKKGQFDSDPHWWMPLTLPLDAYSALMGKKGVDAKTSAAHHARMRGMLASFETGGAHVLGPVDVGDDAYWWDYGQLKLYLRNALRLAEDGAEAGAMREFLGVARGGASGAFSVDGKSTTSSCLVQRGTATRSVLANVTAREVEATGCVLVNVTAKKVVAGEGAIAYNVVDGSDAGLVLKAGEVVTDVFMEDGSKHRQRSTLELDGGKTWKQVVAGNKYSFEGMYKLNQSTNVINASKVGEKAHGDLKRTVSS
mmetsp:Transcript_19709/g.60737  ORF Transcript_19709/g.60737 Transcript_19709/m.60737 type:complete len:536 (-) Transcript_19709:127-1734(-)